MLVGFYPNERQDTFISLKNAREMRTFRIVAMLAALIAPAGVAQAQPAMTGVVPTATGPVQGIVASGVRQFLGIPYAAPPIGKLRWMPPQAPASWTQPLAATRFANFCAQSQRGVFASPSTTEDCLYLNVFAPLPKTGAAKKAVIVWFYGGGLFSGESNDYNGSKLARRGDVVFVSLNYRVGAFGFFSHPAINGEGHTFGNYGIMDQQFALRWVKRNIASFGGDPDNVTIMGQSGGATAVMANLVSPASNGLFRRAINESGTHIEVYAPGDALKAGQDFAALSGCKDQSATCLRSLTTDQILKNQNGIVKNIVNDFVSVDGTIITDTAYHAFTTGNFNRVPILTGLVRDEQSFFLAEPTTGVPLTADGYHQYAASFGAANVATLEATYPLSAYASPSLAEIAMAQGFKACTARALNRAWSKYVPVYSYQFNDRTAPSYFKPVSYPMRAYHTSELQYLFPQFHGGQGTPGTLSPAQETLSDAMVDYWTTFAKTGSPNAVGSPLPVWPRFVPTSDDILYLDLPMPTPATGYGAANDCALWDSVLTR